MSVCNFVSIIIIIIIVVVVVVVVVVDNRMCIRFVNFCLH